MAFHEVRFPDNISRGARGGPERRTQIVELASGAEERNASWADSRRRYDVAYGIRRADDLAAVVAFFEARNGRLHGFRFKDWGDHKSCLPSGTTTLAWCWRIVRADGASFGLTDHDRTLSFDGTEFEPESGLTASEVRSGSDLSVDTQDAEGVLTSDRITETDILEGRWDNAEVEVWRVNWTDTSQRVLMRRGAIG